MQTPTEQPQRPAADDLDADLEPSEIDVRKLRQSKGWSIEKLAAEAGCSSSYLSRIESGQRRPSRYFADHLLRVLLGDVA